MIPTRRDTAAPAYQDDCLAVSRCPPSPEVSRTAEEYWTVLLLLPSNRVHLVLLPGLLEPRHVPPSNEARAQASPNAPSRSLPHQAAPTGETRTLVARHPSRPEPTPQDFRGVHGSQPPAPIL